MWRSTQYSNKLISYLWFKLRRFWYGTSPQACFFPWVRAFVRDEVIWVKMCTTHAIILLFQYGDRRVYINLQHSKPQLIDVVVKRYPVKTFRYIMPHLLAASWINTSADHFVYNSWSLRCQVKPRSCASSLLSPSSACASSSANNDVTSLIGENIFVEIYVFIYSMTIFLFYVVIYTLIIAYFKWAQEMYFGKSTGTCFHLLKEDQKRYSLVSLCFSGIQTQHASALLATKHPLLKKKTQTYK